MNDAEAAAQQVAALETIRRMRLDRHENPLTEFTNGHSLAYWGSLESINGARVVDARPCDCYRCALLATAGKDVIRVAAVLELNGERIRIAHCSPAHIH